MECTSTFIQVPETVYTSLSYPALLLEWLITLTLTLINYDNIILEKSAGSNGGVVHVDIWIEKQRTCACKAACCLCSSATAAGLETLRIIVSTSELI